MRNGFELLKWGKLLVHVTHTGHFDYFCITKRNQNLQCFTVLTSVILLGFIRSQYASMYTLAILMHVLTCNDAPTVLLCHAYGP